MGLTLRSFPLSKGIRGLSPTDGPACRSTCRYSRRPKALGRPNRPRFPGFDPSESPWRSSGGLAHRPLDAPLGFALLGFASKSLVRASTRTPLTRFAALTLQSAQPAPQSIYQLLLGPIHGTRQAGHMDKTTLLGFSHLRAPVHLSKKPSGLWDAPEVPSISRPLRRTTNIAHESGRVNNYKLLTRCQLDLRASDTE